MIKEENVFLICLFFTLIIRVGTEHCVLKWQSLSNYIAVFLQGNNQDDSRSDTRHRDVFFEESFESKMPLASAVNMQTATSYGFKVETDTVYEGEKSGRFELRCSDPIVHNGKRAELFVTRRTSERERWYSYAAYFPSKDYAYDSESDVISQWWQTSGSTQATSLRVRKDRLILRTGNKPGSLKEIDLGAVSKDSWQEFVFHFVHSYGSDGLIEIWRNGTKILEHKGGNMYDTKMPYWKIGIYKAAWNSGSSETSKRVIYFDNIRVGTKDADLNTMMSGAN